MEHEDVDAMRQKRTRRRGRCSDGADSLHIDVTTISTSGLLRAWRAQGYVGVPRVLTKNGQPGLGIAYLFLHTVSRSIPSADKIVSDDGMHQRDGALLRSLE